MVAFFRSPLGALVGVVLLFATAASATVGYQVFQVVHPRAVASGTEGVAGGLVDLQEVSFRASDGVRLAGWWIEGEPGTPAIVLAHDAGETRTAMLNAAIALRQRGFAVLLFDFRGHGASERATCTFGIREKRDVIGALDYAASRGGESKRPLGAYGAGMGAQAAALAAADRPAASVLVLDGLYPDAEWPVVRESYPRWPFAIEHLAFGPRAAFSILTGSSVDEERAADVLPRLGRRNILLLAPDRDPALAAAMKEIYDRVPQRKDLEANWVALPATHASGLRGTEAAAYHERVATFFETRLHS